MSSLLVRGNRPGKQVQLAEHEIRFLCGKSRDIFMRYVCNKEWRGRVMGECESEGGRMDIMMCRMNNLKYSSQPILLDLEAPLKICGELASRMAMVMFVKDGPLMMMMIYSRH